ncbi:hypothetical protein BJ166DRAFT_598776 [Pestalotiopsis sp. NC0098]|nr:hypothetical protein BJ166DRAFT_598776 [Pestalotiopsis sp. NC0098]
MSSNNQNTAIPAAPLNPSRRPQRLYQKVQVAMSIVKEKLKDPEQTKLGEWLSENEIEQFQRAVRKVIRKRFDETFDLWVTRVPHDYVPDARQAIVQALEDGINEPGSMFDASVFNTEEETWDSFVVSDFLLPAFYTK